MRQLDVYSDGTPAGRLIEENPKKYVFKYFDTYFNDPSTEPVSLTLPKSKQVYESEYLFPFFSNMLPEGANKQRVCTWYHLDENDEFALLMFYAGKDFIGNVSVEPVNEISSN